MIIRGPQPERNFYILDKRISGDRRLSWAARGMLIFLLGKPDNWSVMLGNLINEVSDSNKASGRDATYGILAELEAAGYITRGQERSEDGVLGRYTYTVREAREQPVPGLPLTAQPCPANPPLPSIEALPRTEEETSTGKKEKAAVKKSTLTFNSESFMFEGITPEVVAEWKAAYPAVDVDIEILRSQLWLKANTASRYKNYMRFLTGWLARTNRPPPPQGGNYGNRQSVHDQRADFLEGMRKLTDRHLQPH